METSIGGANRAFPSTLWSDVLAAGPESPEGRRRLERLLGEYWKPVYAYVRTAWRKPVEDAKDLTQAFFARLLEKGYLANLRPDKGSFRGYLKTALKHFVLNSERGSGPPVLSLDAGPDVLERLGPASPEESPERAYDRAWFRCVIDAAVEDLRGALAAEGRASHFEIFQAYCLQGGSEGYRELGERLGCSEADVRYRLAYARAVFRRLLSERVGEYATDVEKELAEILAE